MILNNLKDQEIIIQIVNDNYEEQTKTEQLNQEQNTDNTAKRETTAQYTKHKTAITINDTIHTRLIYSHTITNKQYTHHSIYANDIIYNLPEIEEIDNKKEHQR